MRVKKILRYISSNVEPRRIARNIRFFLENDYEDVLVRVKEETLEESYIERESIPGWVNSVSVRNCQDTLALLKEHPLSYARFGDGEVLVMEGGSAVFQEQDERLSKDLKAVLASSSDNLYVGINGAYWQSPFDYSERNHKFYRLNSGKLRKFFAENCRKDAIYLNAACFNAYYVYSDDFDYDSHYETVQSLFEGKRIAIVSGEGVLDRLSFNVFSRANEIKHIKAPSKNAYAFKEEILRDIRNEVDTSWLLCLILGPTATVLAAELADLGYVAWDVGHIAKDFDAYMSCAAKTDESMAVFWGAD